MESIFRLLFTFHQIYSLCIFAWVLVSWLPMISPQLAYNGFVVSVRKFLDSVVEPWVKLFRGAIPPQRIGGTMLDLSAIVAILAWQIGVGYALSLLAGAVLG